MQASKQLDPHITLSIKQRFKNADQAQFLPGPLYVLFSHFNAYKESYGTRFCFEPLVLTFATDLDVDISVEGNIDDAKTEYGKVNEKKRPVNEDEAYSSHPLYVQLSFSKVNCKYYDCNWSVIYTY